MNLKTINLEFNDMICSIFTLFNDMHYDALVRFEGQSYELSLRKCQEMERFYNIE